jgi:hypothetical protein
VVVALELAKVQLADVRRALRQLVGMDEHFGALLVVPPFTGFYQHDCEKAIDQSFRRADAPELAFSRLPGGRPISSRR